METQPTGLLRKTLSSVFPNKRVLSILEVLFLVLLGIAAIALHARLRIPLHLPGRQGLLFLALILFGRLASNTPYAALLSMAGAAGAVWTFGMGFHDPFMPAIYILLGFAIDLAFWFHPNSRNRVWFSALTGGLIWMSIPLFRLIISLFTSIPYQSFRSGYIYPFATHLLFGVLGGLLAFSLYRIFNRS